VRELNAKNEEQQTVIKMLQLENEGQKNENLQKQFNDLKTSIIK
jgi:hypothetical protein